MGISEGGIVHRQITNLEVLAVSVVLASSNRRAVRFFHGDVKTKLLLLKERKQGRKRSRHQGSGCWVTIKPFHVPSHHSVGLFLSCIMQGEKRVQGEWSSEGLMKASIVSTQHWHLLWVIFIAGPWGKNIPIILLIIGRQGHLKPCGGIVWQRVIFHFSQKSTAASPGGAITPPLFQQQPWCQNEVLERQQQETVSPGSRSIPSLSGPLRSQNVLP